MVRTIPLRIYGPLAPWTSLFYDQLYRSTRMAECSRFWPTISRSKFAVNYRPKFAVNYRPFGPYFGPNVKHAQWPFGPFRTI